MNYRGVKLASIMTVAIMLFAGFMVLVPTNSAAADVPSAPVNYVGYTLDQSKMKAMGNELVIDSSVSSSAPGAGDAIGTHKNYIYTNFVNGYLYYPLEIVKRAEGDHCEVWVAWNLNFTGGDPRNDLTLSLMVNDSMVDMIVDEFDNNIYPVETEYFSDAPDRNGSESYAWDWGCDDFNTTDGKKTMIVVMNIKDDNYYDSDYPYYIVGYYSSTNGNIYDRNIIHIDSWDWANRTGVQESNPARSYLYESTVAHEYQHLLHDYLDSQESTWLNEGCSDFAEYLCGYGVPVSHIASFLATPNNSLTLWGDQGDLNILADYGAAALFMFYMNDHFGGAATISDLVKSNLTSTNSVNAVLRDNGFASWDFNKVFKAWRLANLIRGNQPGNGLYDYTSLDLDDIAYLGTLYYIAGSGAVQRDYDWYGEPYGGTGTVNAYGTDYVFTDRAYMRTMERLRTWFMFEAYGSDVNAAWTTIYTDNPLGGGSTSDDNIWYWSYYGDEVDRSLIGTIDLSQDIWSSHTLTIGTAWDIEEDWDFGFVQVSTDGGQTWTSLENAYTTDTIDPSGMQVIADQLPGITGTLSYGEVSWDLSAYDDMVIQVRFRYMTDWVTYDNGWFIDWIAVDYNIIDECDGYGPFLPVYDNVDWMISMVLYNRFYMPLGIVNVPLHVEDIGYGYDYVYADYRPWLRRVTTSACILISPTAGMMDYYMTISNNGWWW